MEEVNRRSRDDNPLISPNSLIRLPTNRDSSRFSTTNSFYEFIDQELREEEERDMLILKIRENIIGTLVDELYDRYMDRQVIPFTVRCYQEALKKLLNWYYFPRDPEDSQLDWEEDDPPLHINEDNWASYCIPGGGYPSKIEFKFKPTFDDDEEEEEEEVGGEDLPDFSEFDGETNFMPTSPEPSFRRFRSTSDPGSLDSLVNHSVYGENVDESRASFLVLKSGSSHTIKSEMTRLRKTQFQVPPERAQKPKKECHFWLNPMCFPLSRYSMTIQGSQMQVFRRRTLAVTICNNYNLLLRGSQV